MPTAVSWFANIFSQMVYFMSNKVLTCLLLAFLLFPVINESFTAVIESKLSIQVYSAVLYTLSYQKNLSMEY